MRTHRNLVYDLDLRFDCPCNIKVTEEVIGAVKTSFKGSYTEEQIASCCKVYFTNLRADKHRLLNGTMDTHRKRSSRSIRLKRKLERRRAIIEGSSPPPLSDSDMALAREMISMENVYMSSDESETEETEGAYGPTRKVRLLSWQSRKMTHIKDIIDQHGIKMANQRQKSKMTVFKRDSSCEISARPVPKRILNWAIDVFYTQ